jgi:hypothetical protein
MERKGQRYGLFVNRIIEHGENEMNFKIIAFSFQFYILESRNIREYLRSCRVKNLGFSNDIEKIRQILLKMEK